MSVSVCMHASFTRKFCLKHLYAPKKAESKVANVKLIFGGYYCKDWKKIGETSGEGKELKSIQQKVSLRQEAVTHL